MKSFCLGRQKHSGGCTELAHSSHVRHCEQKFDFLPARSRREIRTRRRCPARLRCPVCRRSHETCATGLAAIITLDENTKNLRQSQDFDTNITNSLAFMQYVHVHGLGIHVHGLGKSRGFHPHLSQFMHMDKNEESPMFIGLCIHFLGGIKCMWLHSTRKNWKVCEPKTVSRISPTCKHSSHGVEIIQQFSPVVHNSNMLANQ